MTTLKENEVMDDLREHISLSQVAEKYNIHLLKKKGNTACPFCQGTSSLNVKNDKYFKCYRCDAKGSIFDLLILSGVCKDFSEALTRLSADFQIDNSSFHRRNRLLLKIFHIYQDYYKENKEIVSEYADKRGWSHLPEVGYCPSKDALEKRGISVDELRETDLISYMEERDAVEYYDNHLIFPVYDKRGYLRHLCGRALDNREVRWKSTKGHIAITNFFYNSEILYTPKENYLILCEGISDCVSLLQLGLPAIGQFGININLAYSAEYFSNFEYIVAVFDKDKYAIGTEQAGKYKSWSQMMPSLIDLLQITKKPIYYMLTPNISGVKDINDWLISIDYDKHEYLMYGLKNCRPISALAYRMYKDNIKDHPFIWKTLTYCPDADTEAKMSKHVADNYDDWPSYLLQLHN